MMKLIITYPDIEHEKQILSTSTKSKKTIKSPQIEIGDFCEMRDYIREHILVSDILIEYVSSILDATRKYSLKKTDSPIPQSTNLLSYGASTRAGIALIRAAQILALLEGRDYILPEDIKILAHDILRHRIRLSYESQRQSTTTDMIISKLLDEVKIP